LFFPNTFNFFFEIKGLELKRIELGEDHESVSWSLFNLGIVYRLQNR